MLSQIFKKKDLLKPQPTEDSPMVFVEVSPAQATPEPPKTAKFYSDKNSVAANPEPDKLTADPKIDGNQTQVIRTEDVPRDKYMPLQPTPPPEVQKASEAKEEQKADTTYKPGDLALARPDTRPDTNARKEEGQQPEAHPKTILEAKLRQLNTLQPDNRLAGRKTHQEGGVGRRLELTSLDAKATPFGAYDYLLIQAVQARWFALLDERGYAAEEAGRVTVRFNLHPDGRVSEVSVGECTVGEVLEWLCRRAVTDPAPFEKWPREMTGKFGDERKIQFTFFYN
jgi:hypothetical protein